MNKELLEKLKEVGCHLYPDAQGFINFPTTDELMENIYKLDLDRKLYNYEGVSIYKDIESGIYHASILKYEWIGDDENGNWGIGKRYSEEGQTISEALAKLYISLVSLFNLWKLE